MRKPTPWEKLDGIKHLLDLVLEDAVTWERERIINNPSSAFTEPCEACGVSEFQLGVKHAEERIRQEILGKLESISFRHDKTTYHLDGNCTYMSRDAKSISIDELMDALIKGEQK